MYQLGDPRIENVIVLSKKYVQLIEKSNEAIMKYRDGQITLYECQAVIAARDAEKENIISAAEELGNG